MKHKSKFYKKFIVLNFKHFYRLPIELRSKFLPILEEVDIELKKMNIDKKYLVINEDEIYASIVKDLILLHEDLKEAKNEK